MVIIGKKMLENENKDQNIPKDHPRYQSLIYRHKIIKGMKNLVVAEAGLIAHGRGECFDYILGEMTSKMAKDAIKAAVAALLLAERPVISVNGNSAILTPDDLSNLSNLLNIPLEINLFYRKEGRIDAIKKILENAGAKDIRGINEDKMVELNGLESNRRKVDYIFHTHYHRDQCFGDDIALSKEIRIGAPYKERKLFFLFTFCPTAFAPDLSGHCIYKVFKDKRGLRYS